MYPVISFQKGCRAAHIIFKSEDAEAERRQKKKGEIKRAATAAGTAQVRAPSGADARRNAGAQKKRISLGDGAKHTPLCFEKDVSAGTTGRRAFIHPHIESVPRS